MTHALGTSAPPIAAAATPAAMREKPLQMWTVQQKTVSLFLRTDRFAFSIDGGREKTFRPTLYDIGYAQNLISMFRRTIGMNLENDEPNSACFLPKLCAADRSERTIQVALFGRVDVQTRELKGMRWGLFNSESNDEQTFAVNVDDTVARKFLSEAPGTNQPHMELQRDKDGKEVLRPTKDHYSMNSYAKRFSIVLQRDEAGGIEAVALHQMSLIDRTKPISEHNWAVTLVSMMDSTKTTLSPLFRGRFGHSMLACEGIDQGNPFLRYLHLTQNPREKNPELTEYEAQIETIHIDTPLNTINGPTWIRSRQQVEHMFTFMAKMEKVPLKFALYGTSVWSTDYSMSLMQQAAISKGVAQEASPMQEDPLRDDCIDRLNQAMHTRMRLKKPELGKQIFRYTPQHRYVPMTCFDWACEIARKGGIILYENVELIRPIEKIRKLRLGDILTLPRGEPSVLLEEAALRGRVVSASALLTHEDSSPKECDAWAREWVIESIKTGRFHNLSTAINAWAIKFPPTESKEE